MIAPVVLCVDDEVMVLTSLESALKKAFGDEITLEFAENAKDGLEILNELLEDNEQIAMVISDYIMPGMKGDEFLKKVAHSFSRRLIEPGICFALNAHSRYVITNLKLSALFILSANSLVSITLISMGCLQNQS